MNANSFGSETSPNTRRTANSSKPLQAFVDDPDRPRTRPLPPPPRATSPQSRPSSVLSSPPSSPSPLDLSSSDDSDSTVMASSTTPGLSLGDYKTPPSVTVRTLPIDDILSFTLHVQRYCLSKGYVEREKQRDVLVRCCQHRQSITFFNSNKAALDKLNDAKFIGEVFGHFAGRKWRDQVVEMIDNTKQDLMHDKSFQSLLDRLNELNDLLEGSDNHLDANALRNKAYAACSKNFRKFLVVNDVTIALPYEEWVKSALAADEKYSEFQKEHDERLDSITSLLAATAHKRDLSYNSGNHYSSEQPRKQRSYQNASSSNPVLPTPSAPVAAVANAEGRYECPSYQVVVRENPELRALCNSTQMCHGCWVFRPGHMRKDCPIAAQGLGPPSLEVPYRHINQADANFIRDFTRKHERPITLNAVLKARPAPVAAVHAVDDISSFASNAATSGTQPTMQGNAPLWSNATAAVFNTHPVHHVAQGVSVFDQRMPSRGPSRMSYSRPSSAPPVAAVIEPYDGDDDDDEFSDHSPSPRPAARMSTAARGMRDTSPAAVSIGSVEEEVSEQPLRVPHFFWHTTLKGPKAELSLNVLMDDGSYLCIIRRDVALAAGLQLQRVQQPETTSGASGSLNTSYTHITKFRLRCPISNWKSRIVRAFVADSLCAPMILGRPFLKHNRIVTNHDCDTMINLDTGIDLMHPQPPLHSPPTPVCTLSPKGKRLLICKARLDVLKELKSRFVDGSLRLRPISRVSWEPTVLGIAAPIESIPCWAKNIRRRVESLSRQESLDEQASAIKEEFADVFGEIPHVDDLPDDIVMKITLKNAHSTIQARSYKAPRKLKEAWDTLLQKNIALGRLRPSNSQFTSPAFLVPKADPNALPRWVNDYRCLNANTVPDRHPLPRIEDILADAAKGKILGKVDMTDSFYQTKLHPDSIPLTAVNTPLGLYEWVVMPQGLRNSPAVHQRRVVAALRPYIGKFCHVYLDDIIIWSDTEEEHAQHVRLILEALRKARLYCNPKKCCFFQLEIDFLGFHISQRGIEAQQGKADAVLNFPRPTSATEMRRFLGMVRFIAGFLENLAEYTRILDPLTKRECEKNWPEWTMEHEQAFVRVKELVTSRSVLTTIDHANPEDNKIFLVTDASEWRTGAILMWGRDLRSAKPVAFDSQKLSGAEKNYPVHEKELLAIIRALKKWRADCIGMTVHVMTDHRTLENFTTQKDLSRRQLRWQEFLSQYDLVIAYIKGTDNTGADALSRVQDGQYTHEEHFDATFSAWPCLSQEVAAVLSISSDMDFRKKVIEGYSKDPWCKKLLSLSALPPGISSRDKLWYVGDRLIVPKYSDLRENLFRVAHDDLGHFGFDKSYGHLRDSFYWPNMRRDFEHSYIPGCDNCQRNKSSTRPKQGPLHPLPVPDSRLSCIAMDFVGPLPEDQGFNCILSMTCRLGSDIKLAATRVDISAAEAARVFFEHWYCDNGLPMEIVCDRDKLWMSEFWKALMLLTGIKLKASAAYHPESDGASEKTNKTFVQSLRYYVDVHHRGWARALPKIRFEMCNSVNASTGFSAFMLKTGRSPRVLPPVQEPLNSDALLEANTIISEIKAIEDDAKDALAATKVMQAFQANKHRGKPQKFGIGDSVMLTTLHRRRNAKRYDQDRALKFFARQDGPYKVTKAFPECDTYALGIPGGHKKEAYYYVSDLVKYIDNDDLLFPGRRLERPGPVMVDGLPEQIIEEIVDAKRAGRGWKFKVHWKGYPRNEDEWLKWADVDECEALEIWIRNGGAGPESLKKEILNNSSVASVIRILTGSLPKVASDFRRIS